MTIGVLINNAIYEWNMKNGKEREKNDANAFTYLVSFDPEGFDILQDSDKETKIYSLKTISTHYTAWRYKLEQKKTHTMCVCAK